RGETNRDGDEVKRTIHRMSVCVYRSANRGPTKHLQVRQIIAKYNVGELGSNDLKPVEPLPRNLTTVVTRQRNTGEHCAREDARASANNRLSLIFQLQLGLV